MSTFKKKDLNELVGGDFTSSGGDRNVTNNSEIETGPVQKPFNDDSDYEKGVSTTTDKVFGRYRQNIPWFAVYSFGARRSGPNLTEDDNLDKSIVIKKKTVEEKIEDLVKKSKDSDLNGKDYNPKVSKLIDTINDCDLNDKQLEDLSNAILAKKNSPNKTKNL
jgi:hypothetical protein